MPVRSFNSSVLKWPDAETVDRAAAAWAKALARDHPEVLRIGYFGSYARGDWGVGSDLDLVLVLANSPLPFERRSVEFRALDLPVPADVLVYTLEEWDSLLASGNRFSRVLAAETVWLVQRT